VVIFIPSRVFQEKRVQKIGEAIEEPLDKWVSLIGKENAKAKNVIWWTILEKCQIR
jgi:hypothetical protein